MPGSVRVGSAWLLALLFLWLARPNAALLAVGAGVATAGLALRGWAAGAIDKGAELAVHGPYAHTRNPLYLGSFVIGVGLAVSGGHWAWPLVFAGFFLVVYVPTMRREAVELTDRFGSRYLEYAAHVPGFSVRLTPYRMPALADGDPEAGPPSGSGFSWRRYMRYREWEATLGVLAMMGALAAKTWVLR